MKNLYSLVIVALMVAPVSALRADNLDDSSSSVPARVSTAGKITVDAGLIYLLNKFAYVPGTDQASILKMKEKLERARNDVKYYGMEEEALMQGVGKKSGANWAEINNAKKRVASIVTEKADLVAKRDELRKFYASMRPDRAKAINAFNKLQAVEKEIAALQATELELATMLNGVFENPGNKAIAELMAQRDEAVKLIEELPDSITGAQRVGTGMKIIRWIGNAGLGLDMAGHGWAFYDNSSTPRVFGGLSKLTQEGHDAMFAKMKERTAPPVIDEKAINDAKPRRATLAPQGPVGTHSSDPVAPVTAPSTSRPSATTPSAPAPVIEAPVNRLPPLQKKAPEFKKKTKPMT